MGPLCQTQKGRPALPGLLFLSGGIFFQAASGPPPANVKNGINFPPCGHPRDSFPAEDNLLLTEPEKFVIILTLII